MFVNHYIANSPRVRNNHWRSLSPHAAAVVVPAASLSPALHAACAPVSPVWLTWVAVSLAYTAPRLAYPLGTAVLVLGEPP